ncbi:MAG: hypothetical protein ABI534_03235 [Chloroflexota bacterium]
MSKRRPSSPAPRPRQASLARRPMLMALVYGVFLVLIGVTASVLVVITTANVKTA